MKRFMDFYKNSTSEELGAYVGEEILRTLHGEENEFFSLEKSEGNSNFIIDKTDSKKFFILPQNVPPEMQSFTSMIHRYIYRYGIFNVLFNEKVLLRLANLKEQWFDDYLTPYVFDLDDSESRDSWHRFNQCAGAVLQHIFKYSAKDEVLPHSSALQYLWESNIKPEDFNKEASPEELGAFIGNEIIKTLLGLGNEFFFLEVCNDESNEYDKRIRDACDYEKFYLNLYEEPSDRQSLASMIQRYIYRYGLFKILFSPKVLLALLKLEEDWIDGYLTANYFKSNDEEWENSKWRFNTCAGAALRQLFSHTEREEVRLTCPEFQYLKDSNLRREDFNQDSTPEQMGEFIGEEILRVALGMDNDFFLYDSPVTIVDCYDLQLFSLNRISGSYHGSLEGLIQRFLYHYGFFKFLFSGEILDYLEPHKNKWLNYLLHIDEEIIKGAEKAEYIFQSSLNSAVRIIYRYLKENNLIPKKELNEWSNFEEFEDEDLD